MKQEYDSALLKLEEAIQKEKVKNVVQDAVIRANAEHMESLQENLDFTSDDHNKRLQSLEEKLMSQGVELKRSSSKPETDASLQSL